MFKAYPRQVWSAIAAFVGLSAVLRFQYNFQSSVMPRYFALILRELKIKYFALPSKHNDLSLRSINSKFLCAHAESIPSISVIRSHRICENFLTRAIATSFAYATL